MSRILHVFIEQKKSITKLITYSDQIKDMYTKAREGCHEHIEISKLISDFAYAPHRYNSEAKVLLRLVITLDAVLTVASQVVVIRGHSSEEGKAVIEMMEMLDDEVVLQLGMMAEAAVELDAFVRFGDESNLDEAELPEKQEGLKTIIDSLFVKGQCMHIPGVTSIAFKTLRMPRTYIINKTIKTIGSADGPSEEIVTRCLRRMSVWAKMATSVIDAEFPDWELVNNFKVFNLHASGETKVTLQQRHPVSAERKTCLRRLAKAIGVPEDDLITEFHHFEPFALKNKTLAGKSCSNFEAWSKAVMATQKERV